MGTTRPWVGNRMWTSCLQFPDECLSWSISIYRDEWEFAFSSRIVLFVPNSDGSMRSRNSLPLNEGYCMVLGCLRQQCRRICSSFLHKRGDMGVICQCMQGLWQDC